MVANHMVTVEAASCGVQMCLGKDKTLRAIAIRSIKYHGPLDNICEREECA